MSYPGAVMVYGFSLTSDHFPYWCRLGDNLTSGSQVINGLDSLYGGVGVYLIYSFSLSGNTLTVHRSNYLASEPTMPATPASGQDSFSFTIGAAPGAGYARVNGTTQLNATARPYLTVALYNIDSQNTYMSQSGVNAGFNFDSIPAGRYLLISNYFKEGIAYSFHRYLAIQPGDNDLGRVNLVLP